jgi:hypothetical protein
MFGFSKHLAGIHEMANDSIPYYTPAFDLPCQVTAAVTGKRFVAISAARVSGPLLAATADGGNYRVAQCGAGGRAVGVSKYDQGTVGGKLGIHRIGVVPVTAGAAITAGQDIMSDATGQAVPWTSAASEANKRLGTAMNDAANGADCEVSLQII